MKKLIAIAAVLCLAVPIGWFGKPVYTRLMARRLTHAAKAAEGRRDYQEASRLYSLALQRDPTSVATLRSCAAFLAKARHPQLLRVRKRISNLEPNSAADLLDYIEAALLFREPRLARSLLLNRAKALAGDDARFHHLLSISHHLANELQQADAACVESIKRAPDNKTYRVNQATIRLACPDPAVREGAIATLDQFSKDPEQATAALGALLNYASSVSWEPHRFRSWLAAAQACLSPQDAVFPSYLLAVRRWRPDQFDASLSAYTKAAAADEGAAIEALGWLTRNKLFPQAFAFQASLPARVQSSSEGLQFTATALYELKRVEELSAFLQRPEWQHCHTFQMAWLERTKRAAQGAREDASSSISGWRAILAVAKSDPQQLTALVQMADDWRWEEETDMTLWALVDHVPGLADASLRDLARRALARGDCNAAYKVLDRQFAGNPGEPIIANNLAFLSFLRGTELTKAMRLSDDLCRRFPKNPLWLATNAFGRFTRGDIPGGLKLFETVDTESLKGTAPGVTYGLLLAAARDPRAGEYLHDAERWTHFPEERRLIADARKSIQP